METSPAVYPVRVTFDPPDEVARWRPLVAWLLVIPHLIVLYFLQLVGGLFALVAWFAILFTGKLPEGLAGVMALLVRYQLRATTYSVFLQEEYPPFAFDTTVADPGDYPRVRVDVEPAFEGRNRLTVFFRYFLVLPHAIVLMLLGIVAGFAVLLAWFAVLFTKRWPAGLRTFMLGYLRWSFRVIGYGLLLTDEYPPFSLD